MPTIPQRIASAFAVLCGRYGDVTQMAKDREQSRQSLYREAEQVVEAVDGAAAEARIDELQRQLAEQRGRGPGPPASGWSAPSRSPPRSRHEFASVAQAEGVSLERRPPALAGRGRIEARPERGDAGAGHPRGRRARRAPARGPRRGGPAPRSSKPPPMRFFRPQPGPDGGRAREPLLDDRPDGRGPRRRHLGRGVRPAPGVEGRGPRRRHRPG